jgi:hypothetical protein
VTRQIIVAVLSAPAAAAVTCHLLFFTLFMFPGEILTGRVTSTDLWYTLHFIPVAFVCGLVMEVVVGLPLLAVFRWIGWLSVPAFLAAGCVVISVFYFWASGMRLPTRQRELEFAVVCVLIPGYVGGGAPLNLIVERLLSEAV